MVEIIRRVDKRKAYYFCFHSMPINERKETSLYAYWLLKFHPFAITDERFEDLPEATLVNESFAAFLIAMTIMEDESKTAINFVPGNYMEKLQYNFRYRCFTIDSMMLVVETMSPGLFEKKFEGQL